MKVGCGESAMVDQQKGKSASSAPRSFGRKPKTRMMPRKLTRKMGR